mgnify:CR=1 FL=1
MKSNPSRAGMRAFAALMLSGGLLAGCSDDSPTVPQLDPVLVDAGREIFRYDTFGDEKYWTDTLRLHEIIQAAVSPATALAVGLKVDVDALPEAVKQAILAGQVNLDDPAVTVALLKMNAVVGVQGQVETINGRDSLVRVGVTCALCHSTVDNSFLPGIGNRLDGWANTTLQPGTIVALSPAVDAATKAILRSWGPGRYDPRINIDGRNTPIVIPPAYGLRGVKLETFTGEGPVSYWNAYVAVTQMHGQGNFSDPRLGIRVDQSPDLVTPKLAALRDYQLSLASPRPDPDSYDAAAAARGRVVFMSQGRCSTCHTGALLTDVNSGRLHQPAETGMDGAYAARTATRAYRTTPLRGLFQHAPYFHDGSAATLADVVTHYDRTLELRLTAEQKRDLIEYLKSL